MARRWTPLGVHSNYRSLDPYPFYIHEGEGVKLWDADGNVYLDFNMAYGALASGHAHPKIVAALQEQLTRGSVFGYEWEGTLEVAETLCRRFGMGQVRFSSTGLEATHHAIRIARAVTGHRYVVKFEGGYHGSHDTLLVGVKPRVEVSGPSERPNSVPAGPGIPSEVSERTRIAPYNDLEATRRIVREFSKDIAAIILEPVAMNMGLVMPEPGFLEGLRELCREVGALLIFDEIKTGGKYYRGAAGRFGVLPEIILLGKSIACGAPLSAIATQKGILDNVGPKRIAHAGTFNANPFSMTACRATLEHVLTEEGLNRSTRLSQRLAHGLGEIFHDHKVPGFLPQDGPSGAILFANQPVRDWRSFLRVDPTRSLLFQFLCYNQGLIPSGNGPDEQWTVSVVHGDSDVDRYLEVVRGFASELAGPAAAGEIEESV
jgi:glutamate-1-semialdehyde 2,1-aminomutase